MGKLFIVGIGPGKRSGITEEAIAAMEKSDVLCGYTVYIELIKSIFPDKEYYTTPMRREIERCKWAVEAANSGKTVSMICSGDAGVYGMAAPLLEIAENTDIDIEIIPGVTAAVSGAAILGAPINHDFCIISLSDLMTPWEIIAKRLEAAAFGDFVICLYNPMSKKRQEHLEKACKILLKYKSKNTVCGWVKNIAREGEEYKILSLEELCNEKLDMFTTVFIGSANTYLVNGKMLTPRGYKSNQKL